MKLEWVRVNDLIVPVLERNELAKLASYIIFSELELHKELLFAKIEHHYFISRPDKIYLTKYLKTLASLGLIRFDDDVIQVLVPPIPVDVYRTSVERAIKKHGKSGLARRLGVSTRTVEAWKSGVVPRDGKSLALVMKEGG